MVQTMRFGPKNSFDLLENWQNMVKRFKKHR